MDQFYIASDILTDIFRVIGSGISPWNNILDPVLNIFGLVKFKFKRSLMKFY